MNQGYFQGGGGKGGYEQLVTNWESSANSCGLQIYIFLIFRIGIYIHIYVYSVSKYLYKNTYT